MEFFDTAKENPEIQNFVSILVKKEAWTLYNYLTLDDELISKLVHDEYEEVESVKISKQFPLSYKISVTKNDKYFYTCIPEEVGFLIRCMFGNSSGAFYKESNENESVLKVDVDLKALRDVRDGERLETSESLSGTRIYTREDFRVLKEILNWLQKNEFTLKKVVVNDLKIVDIETSDYMLKVSLDKGFVETVKDFELISKTGKLETYINDKRGELKYIDLSYPNRVFFKLKNNTENDIMSTATSTNLNVATSTSSTSAR
jgi:hypothetical protein